MASVLPSMDLHYWEERFQKKLESSDLGGDPAHDLAHFRRVVYTSRHLAKIEAARLEVVLPAAWMHDLINVPKNDPRRSQASRLSAQAACSFLEEIGYSRIAPLADIAHAIEAHSYSAQIAPRTLEARIVQDADRLDGLGAVGIARVFAVSGPLGRRFYDPEDPFASSRPWNDLENTIDHFFVKLFKTVETLTTEAGRAEGLKRAQVMREYLERLKIEIQGH